MKSILLALALTTLAAHAAPVPACSASQLSLALDFENGNFNGMSHGGVLVVLRNLGPHACTVPGFPPLIFRDAAKAPLPILRDTPHGMHPGPVISPAIIAPGAEVTASLRWVSSDVYDHGTCLTPATLYVTIAGKELTAPLSDPDSGQICGESPDKVTYTATRLAPDPVYTPQP